MSIIQRQPPRKTEIGPKSCVRCLRWFGPSYALQNETAYCVVRRHNTAAADTCYRFEGREERHAGGDGGRAGISPGSGAPVRTCPKCGRVGWFEVVSIGGRKVCETCARQRFPVHDAETGIVGATPGFAPTRPEPGGGSAQAQCNARRREPR